MNRAKVHRLVRLYMYVALQWCGHIVSTYTMKRPNRAKILNHARLRVTLQNFKSKEKRPLNIIIKVQVQYVEMQTKALMRKLVIKEGCNRARIDYRTQTNLKTTVITCTVYITMSENLLFELFINAWTLCLPKQFISTYVYIFYFIESSLHHFFFKTQKPS